MYGMAVQFCHARLLAWVKGFEFLAAQGRSALSQWPKPSTLAEATGSAGALRIVQDGRTEVFLELS
jgi:hypothetical protein